MTPIFILLLLPIFGICQRWEENNLIGINCGGKLNYFSREHVNAIGFCEAEEGHCRPLCIISRLGMMDTNGYFKDGGAKKILGNMIHPEKAAEVEGAFEACSASFNFETQLSARSQCHSYAPVLDCFRRAVLMICEGIDPREITHKMADASKPWPVKFGVVARGTSRFFN